jgi:hypothetical protein
MGIPLPIHLASQTLILEGGPSVRAKSLAIALVTVVTTGLFASAWAEQPGSPDALQKENAALRARVEKLETDVQQLKDLVNKMAAEKPTMAVPEGLTAAEVQAVKDLSRSGKRPMVSSVAAELYGQIKLDAALDTARTDIGNYAKLVSLEDKSDNDEQFSMTAKQTRLGVRLFGPEVGGAKTTGRAEIDFYGGGDENKPNPMMRHAYLQLDWPDKLSLLAGQTSDVVSPLFPSTLNYTVGWWAGNIGYRRPQVRVTKGFELTESCDFEVQGALTRTITTGSTAFTADPGEDAGFPTSQGRAALSFPLLTDKPTTLGVSGHWGREEYDQDAAGKSRDADSWSVNLDLTLPLSERLALSGEAFLGNNLLAYLGGIGQGTTATLREITASGGWLALGYGPVERWKFNLGASADDAEESDLATDASLDLNSSIFGNAIFSINDKASVGIELSRWYTEYKNGDDGESLRIQMSFMYGF